MAKEIIINQTLNEYRAVLSENGEILDYLIERDTNKGSNFPHVGNIYKGKVLRVLPGMQSAFVDIGHEKAAFLYVDDAYLPTKDEQNEMTKMAELKNQKAQEEKIGETIPDELSTLSESINMKFRPPVTIESFLKEGDEIIVQIAKEPISTKGPRITRHISLPGRHIVFMPFVEHSGVSRRIENEEERKRLKDIIVSIKPDGKGIIARTVAEGHSSKTLKSDLTMLSKIWKDVLKKCEKAKAPYQAYKDLSFVQRVLRDIADEDVNKIIVDTKENLKEVEKFTNKYLPAMKGRATLYNADAPIFEYYGVDIELERALSNKVFLKSGGSINIDQTEALVSIDVNTGKFVGRKNLEETILKTNLEAIKEITYQLRLRNCGGIIIIDFIDMEKEENRETIYQFLIESLKKDRAKTNVLPISNFGLVEMTRKRTRDTLTRLLCRPCPYCDGTGQIKSPTTVSFQLIRELSKVIKNTKGSKVFIYANPEVTAQLCGENSELIDILEEKLGRPLIIRSENSYHIEQYEIYPQEY